MPVIVRPLPDRISQSVPAQRWSGRGYAWGAIFIGSKLPEIICQQFGVDAGTWLPLSQTAMLVALAIIATKLCPIKNPAGFILAVAAVEFGWQVAVPWLEASSIYQNTSQHFDWAGRFFLARAIRTVGAVLAIFTLIGSGIGRDELFLRMGNWRSPVQPEFFLRFRRSIPWSRFTLTILSVFGVILPVYLFFALHPQIGSLSRLLVLLPVAVATSALNAANEEFQHRSVLLARLRNIIPIKEACVLTAALFGLDHYFGQPSGWSGVFLAGTAGWIWAKSMVETRGFTCAFAIHFVQDLVIFGFLAMSVGARS